MVIALEKENRPAYERGTKMINVSRETKSKDKGYKRFLIRRIYYGRVAWNFIPMANIDRGQFLYNIVTFYHESCEQIKYQEVKIQV